MRFSSVIGLAVALSALAVGGRADAYVPQGKPWPGGTIRYFNEAPDQAWPVARAVDVWNRSGARVRFVAVTSAASAQLVIRHFPHNRCVAHARATLGYVRQAVIELPRIDERSDVCNSFSNVHAVAHELGHVLGLGHETRGCSVMNPSGGWRGASLCPSGKQWEWRCGLLEDDDVRGAVAMYGGRARPRSPKLCNAYAAIGAPSWLAATVRSDGLAIELRFPRPAPPAIPLFVPARIRAEGSYAFAGARDACPTNPATAKRFGWSVTVGKALEIDDRAGAPGRYCYAVWAFDGFGRRSARPATAWVDVG